MILRIHDNKTVADIQEKFTMCFPYLKMEFYQESHRSHESSSPKHIIDPDEKIGSIRKKHNSGILEVKSWHETGMVERSLKRMFDLNIQIFRFQEDGWVITTYTDGLTLKEQCDLAKGIKLCSW
jgi:hypothetical protein